MFLITICFLCVLFCNVAPSHNPRQIECSQWERIRNIDAKSYPLHCQSLSQSKKNNRKLQKTQQQRGETVPNNCFCCSMCLVLQRSSISRSNTNWLLAKGAYKENKCQMSSSAYLTSLFVWCWVETDAKTYKTCTRKQWKHHGQNLYRTIKTSTTIRYLPYTKQQKLIEHTGKKQPKNKKHKNKPNKHKI